MSAPTLPPSRLAPPGAGIPAVERLVGTVLVRWHRLRFTLERASDDLRAGEREVLRLLERVEPELRSVPVLIARPRGLEDSSRCWSLYMVVDHLRIVNGAITATISHLTAGKLPGRAASTAAVKPSPDAHADVVHAYRETNAALLAATHSAGDLRTRLRFAHPWFGPLDAAGWFGMVGIHQLLHCGQMQAILAGLPGVAA